MFLYSCLFYLCPVYCPVLICVVCCVVSRMGHLAVEWAHESTIIEFNPLNAELNPICFLLALLGAHHILHVSRIRVKSLTLRLLMSYIYIYILVA